ncbi:DUF3025 domain-containing protein [Paracidovorax anthurii]|uniref:DUF3025 family protein n=1 Tax=Paracidovorax anthurii TaxID=78229 RepID=A0A328ZL50_9BURK|nr:DUF3025 domain-containing protein [Paracidovorax anthurii]RAR85803.1 Protein of unknown function (DUF3025) [Paracidovorax anthurii]
MLAAASVFGAESPWLRPLSGLGVAVETAWRGGLPLPEALNRIAGGVGGEGGAQGRCGVRFVPQSVLEPGVPYERFIHATGTVPTRGNLHDFFNGLIWLHYPRTKRLLNRWQAEAIAVQGIGAVRGPLRDAITVFDENGAVLLAPAALREALAGRAWRRLFVDLRPLWAEARLVVFGHALLEQLVAPRKPLTAHVLMGSNAPENVANVDAWLAGALDPALLRAKPFAPLPVLGVPGWWAENENFCFYDDSSVFRSARPAQSTQ